MDHHVAPRTLFYADSLDTYTDGAPQPKEKSDNPDASQKLLYSMLNAKLKCLQW